MRGEVIYLFLLFSACWKNVGMTVTCNRYGVMNIMWRKNDRERWGDGGGAEEERERESVLNFGTDIWMLAVILVLDFLWGNWNSFLCLMLALSPRAPAMWNAKNKDGFMICHGYKKSTLVSSNMSLCFAAWYGNLHISLSAHCCLLHYIIFVGIILCHQVLCCVTRLTCALVVNRSALQPAGHSGGEPEQQAVLRVLLCAQSGCATPLSCGRHQPGEVLHQTHQRHVSYLGCLVMTVVF